MATKISEKMSALLTGALSRPLRTPDGETVFQVDTHGTWRTVGALQRRGLVVMEMRTVVDGDGREFQATTSWLTDAGVAEAQRQQQRQKAPEVPVSAPQVAEERAQLPEVPESAVPGSMAAAIDVIAGLKVGDRVRVTNPQGRTNDLVVSRGPRRSDGAFGSPESLSVTVSFGPGRYSFEVSAGDLFAQRAGHRTTLGGTRIMRLPKPVPAPESFGDNASAVSARFAAVQSGAVVEERRAEDMSEGEHASMVGERFAEAQRVRAQRVFVIEVTRVVVSYRIEGECPEAGEEDHECTGDCTWLEGDSRELEAPSTEEVTVDADDLEAFEGDAVAWAVDYVRTRTDAVEASSGPIGDTVPANAWLSGSYQDPYQGDSRVTETSVRLTGDWTEEERARVFVGVRP